MPIASVLAQEEPDAREQYTPEPNIQEPDIWAESAQERYIQELGIPESGIQEPDTWEQGAREGSVPGPDIRESDIQEQNLLELEADLPEPGTEQSQSQSQSQQENDKPVTETARVGSGFRPPLSLPPNMSEDSGQAEILSDKVYLQSYFNVLFKTPFQLEEDVRITTVGQSNVAGRPQVLRTERLDYSRYRTEEGRARRAFILGFYTVSPGLHQLPQIRFQSTESRSVWQSPALPFASFRVDEGDLVLPVNVEMNRLPEKVYPGQNILLNIWANRVEAIDQSSLPRNLDFAGFLIQKSPVTPEVERVQIQGKDVYRVSLGTWLLNPVERGLLRIPPISALVMGLERRTAARQLEVLPLPPNRYLSGERAEPDTSQASGSAVAIGQFTVSFRFAGQETGETPKIQELEEIQESPLEEEHPQTEQGQVPEFAKDELIRVVLRITGHGNIHILSFPDVEVPANLVLLRSEERESLAPDFAKAELYGWREKEFIYKAKSSGEYRIGVDSFHFFDPERGLWLRSEVQELTLQVVNLVTQSYYSNLEDMHFSGVSVFFFNLMYRLQKYAFYICLAIFLLTGVYFLSEVPGLPGLPLLDRLKGRKQIQRGRYARLPAGFADGDRAGQGGPSEGQSRNGPPESGALPDKLAGLSVPDRSFRSVRFSIRQKIFVSPLCQSVLRFGTEHRRVLFMLLITVFIGLLYGFLLMAGLNSESGAKQYYLQLPIPESNSNNTSTNNSTRMAGPEAGRETDRNGLGGAEQLDNMSHLPGNLANVSLSFYRNGLLPEALQVAYLHYFYQPLQPASRRLVSSLRIQQGLDPGLPGFFFWPLHFHHAWRYLAVCLVLAASVYCLYRKKRDGDGSPYGGSEFQDDKENDFLSDYRYTEQHHHLIKTRLLLIYRNYAIVVGLLLLSLSIPVRFSLAVNTLPDLHLEAIPYHSSGRKPGERVGNNVENGAATEKEETARRKNRKNRLDAGELVKIKGRAGDSYTLVIGEKQDQGWLKEQQLFLLPEY
ncbi:hypothetical protein P0082_02980 [Candidatus Haliotispira prima]|uniref:Oxygen tolerance n=1 Tax=Candidatus Haliotispira prima TaxID=3034016 RepID=A0ABY8MIT7_9SPIO|nr:hypothetical protein P0082_02980 [Candidatus Haliotispira prima]